MELKKFKLSDQNKKAILVAFLILSIAGIIYQFSAYQTRLHNIDLAFNFLKDNEKAYTYLDEYQPGKHIPLIHLFIGSLNSVREQIFYVIALSFASGVALTKIVENKN